MGDKEALTLGKEKMEEEHMKELVQALPPGFMDSPLKDSVRYKGQSEIAKDPAKAAMARRLYSVEETPMVKSDTLLPEIDDGKALDKLKNGENKNPDKTKETVPDKPSYTGQQGEEDGANKPLIAESTEKKESTDDDIEVEDDDSLCCLTIKYKPSDKPDWPPRFHIKDIVLAFIGFFTFAIDYGTDIRLLVFYYNEQRLTHLYLTAGFIVVPSFISGVISVIWYKMYFRRDVRNEYEHAKTLYYSRIVLSFLQLGRLWR